jgi:hypothetical protein
LAKLSQQGFNKPPSFCWRWQAKWTRQLAAPMEEPMRLRFHNIEQPKRIAKCLAKHLCIQLSACQNEVAKSAGYRDWHELFNSITLEVSTDLFEDIDVETQAETIVSLANALGADTGDVQFALTEAGAFKALRQSYHHQLALRALCFRLTTIPDQGSRQPGSVGFVKPWKEYVILKEFGQGVHVITNKAQSGLVAKFEYVVPAGPMQLFIPRRLFVVYGKWLLADGSIVLYSRDYEPIWHLVDGQRPRRTELSEEFRPVQRVGFWDDTSTPWRNEARYLEELDRIASYGITGLPKKVELLPSWVKGEGL